jgi:hypothetical protein
MKALLEAVRMVPSDRRKGRGIRRDREAKGNETTQGKGRGRGTTTLTECSMYVVCM